jgi:hypothetical protein
MVLGINSLDRIKSKIRRITGRPSTAQLSDADLLAYINEYYCFQFPLEVKPRELQSNGFMTLTEGVASYDIKALSFYDDNLTLDELLTTSLGINNNKLNLYLNEVDFFDKWPPSTPALSGTPEDVLLYGDTLTFGPAPDADNLRFDYSCTTRPQPFTGVGSEFPLSEEWGPVICYGTSKLILEENGEMELLPHVGAIYEEHKVVLMRKHHDQFINARAKPKY